MFAPGADDGRSQCTGAESKSERRDHRRSNEGKDVMGCMLAPKELKCTSPNHTHDLNCSDTPRQ